MGSWLEANPRGRPSRVRPGRTYMYHCAPTGVEDRDTWSLTQAPRLGARDHRAPVGGSWT